MPEIASLEADDACSERILRDCLEAFPLVRLRVTGDCMRPAVAPGERVLITSTRRRPPRLGDVVLAMSNEGLRLHRLVWGPPLARASAPWRTMGDRGRRFDLPLGPSRILGTVVGVEGRSRPPRGLAPVARSLFRALFLGRGSR